jgi:glycosyltransferase involved in cell wall biosynthesis
LSLSTLKIYNADIIHLHSYFTIFSPKIISLQKAKFLKRAIVSVTNDLTCDKRVDRTCKTLAGLGFDVLLIGRRKTDSATLQPRIYSTQRIRLLFEKGFLFYSEFNFRLFFQLLFKKADLFIANDLDTLLPNYLVSLIRRKPLVYDSHEYFTGVPELEGRNFVKKVWKSIERFIFPKLKSVITVNDSIASLYLEEYKKEITVIRNIPEAANFEVLKTRTELGLPQDKKIVIFQGAGINIDRGGEEAVLSMKYVQNAILLVIGGGDAIDNLKKLSSENDLGEKVIFIPKLPFDKLYEYTVNADLGLTLDKDTNINYRFSLPNKLFDYIHAGIPVLASNLVEIRKIIEEYDIGCIAESHDPEKIAEKITFMLSDKENTNNWKTNLLRAAAELNWNNEEKKLIGILEKYA